MAVAEHFRDQGRHVLFLADSITRFAEAHREIALASGEAPSYRGFPPSTSQMIMALAERSGPGPDGPGHEGSGDITAIFSVLVAGSDMEEPVADILRGVRDLFAREGFSISTPSGDVALGFQHREPPTALPAPAPAGPAPGPRLLRVAILPRRGVPGAEGRPGPRPGARGRRHGRRPRHGGRAQPSVRGGRADPR